MKTFTTYAAKAKQFFNLLQGYTKGIRLTAILLLLLMGVSNAWAYTISSAKVYYDDSNSGWSNNVVIAFDKSNGGAVFSMTKISNTKLHYWTGSWGDGAVSYMRFGKTTNTYNWYDWWKDVNNTWELSTNDSWSGVSNGWGLDIDNTYKMFGANSNTKGADLTKTDLTSYTSLNHDQTVTIQSRTGTSGSYANSSAAGKVSFSSYKLTATTTASTSSNKNITSSAAVSAVYTATATLEVVTTNSGYTFDGWYNSNGTLLSDLTTYTSTVPNATQTIYARFTKSVPKYTITFGVEGTGGTVTAKVGSTTITSGTSHDINTSIVFRATPSNGYNFTKWVDANGNQLSTSASYTHTLTANATVKAVFSLKPAKQVYLKVTGGWKDASPRFAIYAFNGYQSDKWVEMDAVDCNGDYYTAEAPAGYNGIIFVRLKPSTADGYILTNNGLNWDNRWNQTANLTVPTDSKNLFTFDTEGTSWSTYSTPKYDVEVKIVGQGAITIGQSIYNADATIKDIPLTDNSTVGFLELGAIILANNRWSFASAKIKYGNQEEEDIEVNNLKINARAYICGPTTITVTFEQTHALVEFDLQLPTGTTHETIPSQTIVLNATATEPEANNIDGYIFGGWYTEAACTNAYDFSTSVTEDITLYAKWIAYSDCVLFYNTLGWEEVYVYFYNGNYWNDASGTGSNTGGSYQGYAQMKQIEGTNVWYVDATGKSTTYLVFGKEYQENKAYFFETSVSRRGDYKSTLPMFVPVADQTPEMKYQGKTAYYNKGYWMNYPENTGYKLMIFNKVGNDAETLYELPFDFSSNTIMPFTHTIDLEGGKTYGFKILRADNSWYGNNGTMTYGHSGDAGQTAWEFKTDYTNNCGLTTTAPGDYIFTLRYDKDSKGEYNYLVGVEYPTAVGDYRIVYKDNATWTGDTQHDANWYHPSHTIRENLSTSTTKNDTVSFFVSVGSSPSMKFQRCTDISDNKIKWTDVNGGTITIPTTITTAGVYNFIVQQPANGESISLVTAEPYTGDFYIRTDATAGGWKSFRQNSNKMTYNSFADEHSDFNHYFVEWIQAGTNVKFTIANDYSYCISDTLDGDEYITKDGVSVGCLPEKANVRFGWDDDNNKLTRAYISGSSNVHDRFLVVTGNEHLKNANGEALTAGANGSDRYGLGANEDIFKDMGNWVYQVDVTANRNTLINLTAKYNDKVQIFKGQKGNPNYQLLTSTEATNFKIRLIYNFKSNHLVIAWLANNNDGDLGADMMVIREDQGKATQINFASGKSLTNVKTAYAVMTFTNQFVNNLDANHNELAENLKQPEHARAHYWISFPFDVKISDVFGFGEYGDQWILQLYDGAARAKEGYWVDSDSFWRYITNKNYTLKKGVGYVLTLNLNKMSPSTVFEHTDEVSLYFPSNGEVGSISWREEVKTNVPPHNCTITRDSRNIYDSHWNIIGVPGFADVEDYPVVSDDVNFYYRYLPLTNTYQATDETADFQTMYGYMVQYTGDLTWKSIVTTPSSIAARRNSDSEEPEKVSLRLEIAKGEEMADQTFVQLQQEGATAEFDMNLDLTKIINSGANIYTLTDSLKIQTAGNVLPFEENIVAVGVDIATAGEYTFRMPDGTEGMVVELIDYETNTTTNLLLDDYTVNLPTGSNETRFALSIKPEKTATNVGNIGGTMNDGQGVRKFIIDGKLYLQKDGMLYDAQGHIVR